MLDASPVVEIWPENKDVFHLFLRLSSQWNILPSMTKAIRIGLNYQSVEALMRIEKIKDRAAVFSDLQTIEFAALSVFNGDNA